MTKPVDENGVPEYNHAENPSSAPFCPDKPCNFCTGNSAVVKSRDPETNQPIYETSWEWCQSMNTCSATVDWDVVYGR